MFDPNNKEELLKEAKSEYEVQMEEGEFECDSEECSSENFDVNLYVASPSSYQGTAVCRECNERHEITMPVQGLDDLGS
jgi:hypothetical protein